MRFFYCFSLPLQRQRLKSHPGFLRSLIAYLLTYRTKNRTNVRIVKNFTKSNTGKNYQHLKIKI